MKSMQNMGTLDRVLRAAVGVVLVLVGALAGLSPLWTAVAFVVAALMLGTAVLGYCPVYAPFGFHTGPREPRTT